LRGCHVPVQRPSLRETMVRGGSPLEKVATTAPVISGLPQSSTTRASSEVGQEVETPNCSPSDENKGSSREGAHPAPDGGFDAGDVTPGLSTNRMFTVRTDPSANRSVSTPRRTPPVRPAAFGCTRIRAGWLGCTVPSEGRCVNHTAPSVVRRPDVNERAALLRFETVTTCEPGAVAPVTPV